VLNLLIIFFYSPAFYNATMQGIKPRMRCSGSNPRELGLRRLHGDKLFRGFSTALQENIGLGKGKGRFCGAYTALQPDG
jgi:hypothetical protein